MKHIFILSMLFSGLMANGQTIMQIHKSDGSVEHISVSDISNVNFSVTPPPPSLHVTPSQGNAFTITLNEIDSITYAAAGNPGCPATVTDIDGNTYNIVEIGNQCWTKENLRTSRYLDGSEIPNVTDNNTWKNLSTGAWCHYGNDADYDTIYGILYNWYTVADPRGLCPTGWHVSSDAEWTFLTDYLGGESIAGGKMKATTGWSAPNTDATNESGFTGLPGGVCNDGGAFYYVGSYGGWWSSLEAASTLAWARGLVYNGGGISRGNDYKRVGLSVRCVRD